MKPSRKPFHQYAVLLLRASADVSTDQLHETGHL